MKLVLLPGNSYKNKAWCEELKTKFSKYFEEIHTHDYMHWKLGDEFIDIDYEVGSIYEELKREYDYIVLAKSIGSLILLKGLKENMIFPKKCFFVGVPVIWMKDNDIDIDNLLREFKIPSIFIQNSEDPMTDANSLRKYLGEMDVKNFDFFEIDGDSHDYDTDRLLNIFERTLKA